MATLIFVHGTGVRSGEYVKTLALVKRKVAAIGALDVVGVPWGDTVGVTLLAGGASVPDYRSTGGRAVPVERLPDTELEADLLELLFDDPLAELRVLGAKPPPQLVVGKPLPEEVLARKVAKLGQSETLTALLDSSGLAAEFAAAKERVVDSIEFRDALRTADLATADHEQAIARAIVASMRPANELVLELIAIRDDLVHRIIIDMSGVTMAGPTRFAKAMLMRAANRLVVGGRRGERSDSASAMAGDILNYTLSGDAARAMIADAVRESDRPVYLLGHSLGGIMCVDLLCMSDVTVDGLITVGSQAPFMYEVDALRGLSYPDPLPLGFPKWLNVFDKRDLLSYLAAPIFGLPARDFEVNSGEPFHFSHSAYWVQDAMWREIAGFVR